MTRVNWLATTLQHPKRSHLFGCRDGQMRAKHGVDSPPVWCAASREQSTSTAPSGSEKENTGRWVLKNEQPCLCTPDRVVPTLYQRRDGVASTLQLGSIPSGSRGCDPRARDNQVVLG